MNEIYYFVVSGLITLYLFIKELNRSTTCLDEKIVGMEENINSLRYKLEKMDLQQVQINKLIGANEPVKKCRKKPENKV